MTTPALETDPAPLTLTLFGPMRALVAGQLLPPLHSRKSLWLLALLALRHGRATERDWLAGTLWPDAVQEQAFANLRPVLSDLRRALGVESVRLQSPDRHSLRLDLSGADCDVLAFDAAIASGTPSALAQAVVLYTGPLLEGCAEEWIEQERTVREQDCLRALGILADAELASGDHGAAAEYFRRAVALDPWQDAARRGLMEALAQGGDRNAALQAYREFTELLRTDLMAAPDKETRALYARLRSEAGRQAAVSDPSRMPAATEVPVSSVSGHLPQPLTDLVGREDEKLEVAVKLRRLRLVTLTGPGGIGKTRLAIEVAAEAAAYFSDGVWLVALESLTDGGQVVGQVAEAFGLKEAPGCSALQTLTDYLGAKRLLLVLDNCEHLLEASAQLAAQLLGVCAGLRVLATSREPLGITGETIWAVPALTVPDPEHLPAARATLLRVLAGYESVQLFVERAQAVQGIFSLMAENAMAVAQVCSRLEGVPLAIELAAARIKVMTVTQIASRLDDRLGLLTNGSRTTLSRQRTLRATLDWSYTLLNESEQHLLRRLSVFLAGWTAAAAEQVCAGPGSEGKTGLLAEEVLDLLPSLVHKSLVVFDERTPEAREFEGRYRLLETVRQYAAERLATGGEAAEVRARHRDYFLTLAEDAESQLYSAAQGIWLVRLEAERANLRAALDWCGVEPGAAEAGLRLAGALGRFWEMHGDYSKGRAYLSEALGREGAGGRTQERAKALNAAGLLAFYQWDYREARSLQEERLAILRELGNRQDIAWALYELGKLASIHGDPVLGQSLQEEGLALFRELDNRHGVAWSLHELGRRLCEQGNYAGAKRLYEEGLMVLRGLGNRQDIAWALQYVGKRMYEQNDYEGSQVLHEESLAIFREVEDRQGAAWAINELGKVALGKSDFERSRAFHEDGLAAFRELDNRRGVAWSLHHLANIACEQGDYDEARMLHEEGLAIFQALGDRQSVALSLNYLGQTALEQADFERSRVLHEEGLAIFRELGNRRDVAASLNQLGKVALGQGRVDAASAVYAEGMSILRELEDRRGTAIGLRGLAAGLAARGNIPQAARIWGAAEGLYAAGNGSLLPQEIETYRRQVAKGLAVLGEGPFNAAWEQGRILTWEQAVADALKEIQDVPPGVSDQPLVLSAQA